MTPTYSVVRTDGDFANLRPDWTRLLETAQVGSPFLTWEWMHTWWRHYRDRDGVQRRLAIVVAWRGTELVGLIPGYVRKAGAASVFSFLGAEYESTDYLHPIGDWGDGSGLGDGLVELRRVESRLDILELPNALSNEPTVERLRFLAQAAGFSSEVTPHRTCPFIDVAAAGDWAAFFAGRSSNFRKKFRQAERSTGELGVVFECVDDASAIRMAIQELFELHGQRFEAKGADTIFRADRRMPFHQDVAALLFERGILRLFRFRHQDKTIGAMYRFEFAGSLFYLQTGIDPAWEDHSIGTLLVGRGIQHAFERRLALFDFMRGDEAYKFRWTSTTRQMVRTRLGVSARGRAVMTAERHYGTLKALVKRAVGRHA